MKILIYRLLSYFGKKLSGHSLRKKFPTLNKTYMSIRASLAPKKIFINGYWMYLDETDSLGLGLNNGIYEPAETNVIKSLVKEGDIVLDIGVNIGYFTLLLSNLVGQNGNVIAFEPERSNFDLLMKNIIMNNCQNAVCYQHAVSDENNEVKIYLDNFSNLDHQIYFSPGHNHSQIINSVKIDDFLFNLERVDFIKMDIQGSEVHALKGMKKLLSTNKNVKLVTEFWPAGLELAGSNQMEFLDFLEKLEFIFYDINDTQPLKNLITPESLKKKYPPNYRTHTNLLCVRSN